MNNSEQEIVSYLIEEFGKNNLTAIKRKPLLLKWREQIDFISNIFARKFVKHISQHRYIPEFIVLTAPRSEYTDALIKDINIVYDCLHKIFLNSSDDHIKTTLKDVYENIDLQSYQRLYECFYYLTENGLFTSYAKDIEGDAVVFDDNREFFLNDDFLRYEHFDDYLKWFTGLDEITYIPVDGMADLDIENSTKLFKILLKVKAEHFDNAPIPPKKDWIIPEIQQQYLGGFGKNIRQATAIWDILSPHKK